MNRRSFLNRGLKTSILLSVPQFLQSCKSAQGLDDSLQSREILNAEIKKLSPIQQAISIGITAPNPHNTQAWKFLIHNELSMTLYVDEKRILPETDPTTRQIHLGQGCFIELFCIAAKELGYEAKIDLLPEGEYKTSEIGTKPIAHLQLINNQLITKEKLFSAISRRAMNRTEYEGNLLTINELVSIEKLSQLQFSSFHFAINELEIKPLQDLILEAIQIETKTLAKNDESRIWFRFNDEEIFTKKDGISLRGNGLSGMKYWLARNFFVNKDKEGWNSKEGCQQAIELMAKSLKTAKAFAYLKTSNNTQIDWINVGRDFARLHLAVTDLGFVLHPYSQILQEYAEMRQIQQKLNAHLNIQTPEKIQMLFRLGRSDYQFFSPRREISDMIIDKL